MTDSVIESMTDSVTAFVINFKNILKICEYYFYYKKNLTSIIIFSYNFIIHINHFNEILDKVH